MHFWERGGGRSNPNGPRKRPLEQDFVFLCCQISINTLECGNYQTIQYCVTPRNNPS